MCLCAMLAASTLCLKNAPTQTRHSHNYKGQYCWNLAELFKVIWNRVCMLQFSCILVCTHGRRVGYQSTRHTVNSSHGHLVTWTTRHTVKSSQVDRVTRWQQWQSVGTNLIHLKKLHDFTVEFLKCVIFHRQCTEAVTNDVKLSTAK